MFHVDKRKKVSRSSFSIPKNNVEVIQSSCRSDSLRVALARERPARGRAREDPRSGQVLQIPLGRAFRPPRPPDPPGVLLISIQLRIDKMLQIVHVVRAQAVDRAGDLAVAGADVRRAGEGAVVARAFSEAVEPFGAVGLGARPLADNGPLVRAGEFGAKGAGGGDVLGGGLGDFVLGEDLVLMGVEQHVFVTGCGCHETVPIGLEVLEGILDGGREVAAGSCHG